MAKFQYDSCDKGGKGYSYGKSTDQYHSVDLCWTKGVVASILIATEHDVSTHLRHKHHQVYQCGYSGNR